ncbi:hypothetical protein SDC9_176263 [bioreactor metagenome]|uniref:Uncharacterized protein n=1 Tax=bioreactor metagenome TaxID=1076179 RepID=A0A645GPH3_9ZZZZ
MEIDPGFRIGPYGAADLLSVFLIQLLHILQKQMPPDTAPAGNRHHGIEVRDFHEIAEFVTEEMYTPRQSASVLIAIIHQHLILLIDEQGGKVMISLFVIRENDENGPLPIPGYLRIKIRC